MAQKVTAMDIRTATALVGQVQNVAEFCRRRHMSRVTFYKWRRRFAAHGFDGLREESRRPVSCPAATGADMVAMVVDCRIALLGAGLDHGPPTIVWALQG